MAENPFTYDMVGETETPISDELSMKIMENICAFARANIQPLETGKYHIQLPRKWQKGLKYRHYRKAKRLGLNIIRIPHDSIAL